MVQTRRNTQTNQGAHSQANPGDLREQLSRPPARELSAGRSNRSNRSNPPPEGNQQPPRAHRQLPPDPLAPTLAEVLARVVDIYEQERLRRPAPAPVRARSRSTSPEQGLHSDAASRPPPAPEQSVHSRLGPRVPSALERLGAREARPARSRGERVERSGRSAPAPRNRPGPAPRNRQERREEALRRRREEILIADQESGDETPVGRDRVQAHMAELAEEIRDLRQRVEGKDKSNARSLLITSPFAPDILAYKAPAEFKLPEHPTYDGSGDPRDHLISFQAKMQVVGAEDPMFCRAFLPTLTGTAQHWFLSLPEKSITSFEALANRFLTRFAGSMRPKKDFMHLTTIKQKEGESLRDYIARWQKEIQTVEGLDDKTAAAMFVESLRSGTHYARLREETPKTYAQVIQRANHLADTEEALRQKRKLEGSQLPRRARYEEGHRSDRRRNGDRPDALDHRPPARPVNEVREQLPPPPPVRPGDKPQVFDPNISPYCRYHRSNSHSTEECDALKKEIEAIIMRGRPVPPNQWRRQGYSGQTGQSSKSGKDKGKKVVSEEEERNWRHKPVINMIVGGPEGGDSTGARKAWARQLYVGAISTQESDKKRACREPIVFTDDDLPRGPTPHRDALVIAMDIQGTVVRRVLVDTGSSVNILYLGTFEKLGLAREQLRPINTPLAGFTGDSIDAEGSIELEVELGSLPHVQRVKMEFVVVGLECAHNAILGRPGLEDLGALISVEHLCMKFRTPTGVGVVRCDQKTARNCYLQACRRIGQPAARVHVINRQAEEWKAERPEPAVELEEIALDPDRPERRVRIGVGLPEEVRRTVIQVLRDYQVVFAWGPEDMPGVDRSIITHRLSIDPASRPVAQKKRYMANDRREFVKKEVETLLAAGHIREVEYPTWLANVVLVPKPPAWRMCVDYTDLNKACPKDPFPLPRIDQLVDDTAGCALLSFMDAFRGYHQIFMNRADEEKTAFVTPDGVYCYRVMPFGLKNSGATYTRMVARLFKNLLGRSMAAYVDDMLVKSKEESDHSEDLANCFRIMVDNNLRLNPKKCAFAVRGGKFLGYMVTKRGIEPNPEKIKAILEMQPPTSIKETQRLTGRLAALSRFLSKSADRALPFFEAMRKREGFQWTDECQAAFEDLKKYLQSPPLLAKPREGEDLYLYLAASHKAVGSVLVKEEDKVQHPVYYVGRALKGAEVRYTALEKIVFALVVTVRKLVPYFQAHHVKVLTDKPLASVLRSPTSSGRLVKWAMELTQYGLEYLPRPTIKAQALADFLVECSAPAAQEDNGQISEEWWECHVDGAAGPRHCGGGVMLISPEDFRLYYALEYKFQTSNNEAEYEAVIGGLRLARALGAARLRIKTDSRLVVNQVTGHCETKGENLKLYKDVTEGLLAKLEAYEICHVPRAENLEADILSKLALGGLPDHLAAICKVEVVEKPSIESLLVCPIATTDRPAIRAELHPRWSWIADIIRYQTKGELPDDKAEADRVRRRAPSFVLVDGQLYKRSFGGPLLLCLLPDKAEVVMEEAHRGICAAHQGAHTLARKLVLQGYYWPTMVMDCIARVMKCTICQAFAKRENRPAAFYTPVTTAIPFAKWGIDLLGPLPQAPGRHRFCIVAVDYFTKWAEAEPLVTITEYQCRRFIWKAIICRFGLPEQLVSDNGKQFDNRAFAAFCVQHGIRHIKVAVAYPQANGQVENLNRTLLEGLKKKLEDLGGTWVDQLEKVLWTYRTTPRRATGETPFALAYGFEAKVPAEVQVPSRRILLYNEEGNEESLQIEKNFLEERRAAACARMAEYQQAVKRYQDRRARVRYYQVGDLVLRNREASRPLEGGKLSANWEGPYRVATIVRPGTYKLETMTGHPVDRLWNAYNLKRFYQ